MAVPLNVHVQSMYSVCGDRVPPKSRASAKPPEAIRFSSKHQRDFCMMRDVYVTDHGPAKLTAHKLTEPNASKCTTSGKLG